MNPNATAPALTQVDSPRGAMRGFRARWPARRTWTVLGAAAVGAALAVGASWLLRLATSCNGACPTAANPTPFAILLAAVAAWSAWDATRR